MYILNFTNNHQNSIWEFDKQQRHGEITNWLFQFDTASHYLNEALNERLDEESKGKLIKLISKSGHVLPYHLNAIASYLDTIDAADFKLLLSKINNLKKIEEFEK